MKEIEFDIFKELMLEVNEKENRIILREIMEKHPASACSKYFRITNADLIGMKELWNIFLNCKNEKVIQKVVSFLILLHLNYHRNFEEK